jgi:hypothetical protein
MAAERRREEPLGRALPRLADDAWDQVDVPAAVVCALCGDPDCGGCTHEASRSGILAIIPWERPGSPLFARLWATARLTTRDADAFFGAFPDGPVAPALAFAMIAELFAAASWALIWGPFAVAVAPGWCRHVLLDPYARGIALRISVVALPALAFLLVGAHAAHGVSLDHGARKVGAPSARRKALRFGLYATGWDLVVGPLGACILAAKEGLASASEITQFASGLPTRSGLAFLRGVYGLDPIKAKKALGSSYVAAVIATLLAAFIIVGVLVVAAITYPHHFF